MTENIYTISLSPEASDIVERLAATTDLPAADVIRNLCSFAEAEARLYCQWLEGLPKGSPKLEQGIQALQHPGPGRLLKDVAAVEREFGNRLLVGAAAMQHDPACGGICVVSAVPAASSA